MKIGFIMLPLLCAAGVAMAEGESERAADQKETVAVPGKAQAHYRVVKNKPKRLPGGDLRHCLELKTNEEIILCSETRRKQ
jgi:hypothetical protein